VTGRPGTPSYLERLAARSAAAGTVLCLGLDPDPAALPEGFSADLRGVEAFARLVLEVAAPHAAAVKPNLAFFEAFGSAGIGVLDLVERLHPTPAVGGFPRQRALELIREREGLDRGWYAGPIGWLNRDGEGEFVVGIRSALLDGNSATLFAGCGIVGDSNPAKELAESGRKLQPILAALGVAG